MEISGVMNGMMERMEMKLTSSKWHNEKGMSRSGYAGGGAEMIKKCVRGNASFHRHPHLLTAHCCCSSVRCGIGKENNKTKTHYHHHHQTDVEAQPLFSGVETQWKAELRRGPESWRLSHFIFALPLLSLLTPFNPYDSFLFPLIYPNFQKHCFAGSYHYFSPSTFNTNQTFNKNNDVFSSSKS